MINFIYLYLLIFAKILMKLFLALGLLSYLTTQEYASLGKYDH